MVFEENIINRIGGEKRGQNFFRLSFSEAILSQAFCDFIQTMWRAESGRLCVVMDAVENILITRFALLLIIPAQIGGSDSGFCSSLRWLSAEAERSAVLEIGKQLFYGIITGRSGLDCCITNRVDFGASGLKLQ